MNYNDLQEKRLDILRLCAKHGATNVRLFGSVARGEATSTSDVDFLIDRGPQRSPWFPSGLILELEELLGCKVDVVTSKAIHWYIRDRILKEAVPL
jgi:predicted nucleotidyltransferase